MDEYGEKKSGWEHAEKAASGAGAVLHGTGVVLTKLYALGLIVLGVVILVVAFKSVWWGGLLIAGYGVYLLLPGSKWVVW